MFLHCSGLGSCQSRFMHAIRMTFTNATQCNATVPLSQWQLIPLHLLRLLSGLHLGLSTSPHSLQQCEFLSMQNTRINNHNLNSFNSPALRCRIFCRMHSEAVLDLSNLILYIILTSRMSICSWQGSHHYEPSEPSESIQTPWSKASFNGPFCSGFVAGAFRQTVSPSKDLSKTAGLMCSICWNTNTREMSKIFKN